MAGLAAVGSGAGAAGLLPGAVAAEQRRPPTGTAGIALVVPGFATVGAVIMTRHRSHVIGRLFLGLSAIIALGSFSTDYAIRAYLTGGCQPAN
jgi:hypothetical protein